MSDRERKTDPSATHLEDDEVASALRLLESSIRFMDRNIQALVSDARSLRTIIELERRRFDSELRVINERLERLEKPLNSGS